MGKNVWIVVTEEREHYYLEVILKELYIYWNIYKDILWIQFYNLVFVYTIL